MIGRKREQVPCRVCGVTFKTCPNFGAVSCLACASFFRRTVSFGIKFLCKANNNCSILPDVRIICRSCRYDNCIKAGMKRELVQSNRDGCLSTDSPVGRKQNIKSSQNDPKLPKYVARAWSRGTQEVVRGFATTSVSRAGIRSRENSLGVSSSSSSSETSHCSPSSSSSPSSSRSCSPTDKSGFSTILNMSYGEVLQFYVRQTEEVFSKDIGFQSKVQCVNWKSQSDHIAMKLCTTCPGADLLGAEDLRILFRHCQFVTQWMDVAWHSLQTEHENEMSVSFESKDFPDNAEDQSVEENRTFELFRDFKTQLDATFAFEFSRLALDVTEYAALKSFCIWKLGILDSTLTLRVIAEEQYQGVVHALSQYYQNAKNMKPFEMAMRLGDITLMMGPIFSAYQKSTNLYEDLNISSSVNNDL